jgi:hypothetical protein
LKKAQSAVNSFHDSAKWFRDMKSRAEEMVAFHEGLWAAAGKEAERPQAKGVSEKN